MRPRARLSEIEDTMQSLVFKSLSPAVSTQ